MAHCDKRGAQFLNVLRWFLRMGNHLNILKITLGRPMDSKASENVNAVENIFSRISLDEISNKITQCEKLLSDGSNCDVFEIIKDAILIEGPAAVRASAYHAETRTYSPGGLLFRVRNIARGASKVEEGDLWEPPADKIGYGRVNGPGEQFLYTSADVIAPFKEAKIKSGDAFLLITYKVIEPLELFGVGVSVQEDFSLSIDTRKKMGMVRKFLDSNFLSTKENAYLLSSAIAGSVCNFGVDGWFYPSVVSDGGLNLCLKMRAKKKITFDAAFLGIQQEDGPLFEVAIECNSTGGLAHYKDWNYEDSNCRRIVTRFLRKSYVNE